MSTTITVRRAVPNDAEGIVSLHRETWPTDVIIEESVSGLLAKKTHVAFVALEASKVVGYADGFSTFDSQGTRRWELDLLAVQSDIRGNGIGTALIEAQKTHAASAEVGLIRGLVRTENSGGHGAFDGAGFEVDPVVYNLYTGLLPDDSLTDVPSLTHLIPIETFTYRGFWIEGRIRPDTLSDIQTVATSGDRSTVGMLIPEHNRYQGLVDAIPDFVNRGSFQWWTHHLMVQRS